MILTRNVRVDWGRNGLSCRLLGGEDRFLGWNISLASFPRSKSIAKLESLTLRRRADMVSHLLYRQLLLACRALDSAEHAERARHAACLLGVVLVVSIASICLSFCPDLNTSE